VTGPEPGFQRDGTTSLYWTDVDAPVAAFLVAGPDTLGANPSLSATWTGDPGGVYVFLGAPATDRTAFLSQLQDWLSVYRPQRWPRFLWILDPAVSMTAWTFTELYVDGTAPPSWRIGRADFLLAGYTVVVGGGSLVAPGGRRDAGWGFELTDTAEEPAVTFDTPNDRLPARPMTTVLSMEPGHTGTWRFVVDASGADGDGFLRLASGVRYFTPGQDGFVNPVQFAVLRQPAAVDLRFFAELDPLRPFDHSRSALSFFSWSGPGTAPAMPSGYATAYGYQVDLEPLPSGATSTTAARLVFAFAPQFVSDPSVGTYYLAPDGPFRLSVVPPVAQSPDVNGSGSADGANDFDRLVCGTSGLEYLGVPKTSGCSLTFVADQPAFAPLDAHTTGQDALTSLGTTSWVYLEAPATTTLRYYSQPEDAPLFRAPDATTGVALADRAIDLLDFLEIPACDLQTSTTTPNTTGPGPAGHPPAFPMAPFRGLEAGTLPDALAIEQLALAPRRRSVLIESTLSAASPERTAAAVNGGTARIGVTPQGLGVGIAADDLTWTWLGIGHTADVAAAIPDLRFTAVTGPFQQAMQTNNLFMVLGNATEFIRWASVGYELSTAELDVIGTLPEGQGVAPAVLNAVRRAMTGQSFETREDFRAALRTASSAITEREMVVFQRFGGQLTAIVGGWPFRLSPDNWGPSTYLVFKFVLGRSISDLVGDVSTWAWPDAAAATNNPADAQRALAGMISDAAADPSGPYANFVDVVNDPDWTGILALSVEVPLEQLPSELQVLAAGIDPGQFKAHHLGMSVTPFHVQGAALAFERTSMFGLIDYQNPEDQYFTENIAFAFRVLQLTVGIRNSVVTAFSSRAELLMNRLFGAPARLFPTTHGNNIILEGAHQQQRLPDGTAHDTYVFAMSGQNLFRLDGLILQSVELLSTQLVTAKASDPAAGDATVDAVFQMAGNLRFYQPDDFDPFCWGPAGPAPNAESGLRANVDPDDDGYLRFGNLGIAMSFALGNPSGTTVFSLRDGNLSFDAANSVARADSLVSRFPLRLGGLIATADPALYPASDPPPPQSPADMGYAALSAPLQQGALSQPWYGLNFVIDLGTLGALAGSTAISVQVVVAWCPGPTGTEPAVAMGVKLPGTKDTLGVSLPLQGVIKAGFKGIEFLVDNQPGADRTYTLRLRDFALRLLGLSFPPGHNDVILFGNPDQSGASKVGWYLAYASDSDPKRPAPSTRRSVQRSQVSRRAVKEG